MCIYICVYMYIYPYILIEKNDILQRWEEYISDLFHDTRGEKPVIHKNINEPPILESEIRAAIKKAKQKRLLALTL